MFASGGYKTRVTPATSDEGVDIWAQNQDDRVPFGLNSLARVTGSGVQHYRNS
ncbi:hypothetical protein [Haloquadratum walsbyi]|uniref:hypothetical protein n=1 Tax=Haloquadratum walsbyi TaxID=293091 RepID=UPI00373FE0B4